MKYALAVLSLFSVSACAGGQSGNEGELPSPPCPRADQALLTGRIVEVGGGCISVLVEETLKPGVELTDAQGALLFHGSAAPGEIVRARLGRVYAYDHTFALDEAVAAIPGLWGDSLSLELFPRDGSSVTVRWGSAGGELTLEELGSSSCESTARARLEPKSDVGSNVTPTEPPPGPVDCRAD